MKKLLEAKAAVIAPEDQLPETPVDDAVLNLNWDDVEESILVARVLVDQYGADAPLKAEASASRLLLDWADLEAWAYWKRAGKAAEQLLMTEPTGTIH